MIATGSTADEPPFETDDTVPVFVPETALRSVNRDWHDVLVYDLSGNEEGDITWEQLVAAGAKVTMISPYGTSASQLGYTHLTDYLRRLRQAGCKLFERTTINAVRSGTVTLASTFDDSTFEIAATQIVVIGARTPDMSLYEAARAVELRRLDGEWDELAEKVAAALL